jgi:hypothetical protein
MPAPRYVFGTEADSAISAATKKTIAGGKAHANSGLLLLGFWIGFADTNAAEVPALIELEYCTWATNGPGTNSTSCTIRQTSGRVITAGFTAGYSWTAQPTTLTPVAPPFTLTPNGGTLLYDFPFGTEADAAVSEGFALSVTAPSATTVRGGLIVARC